MSCPPGFCPVTPAGCRRWWWPQMDPGSPPPTSVGGAGLGLGHRQRTSCPDRPHLWVWTLAVAPDGPGALGILGYPMALCPKRVPRA